MKFIPYVTLGKSRPARENEDPNDPFSSWYYRYPRIFLQINNPNKDFTMLAFAWRNRCLRIGTVPKCVEYMQFDLVKHDGEIGVMKDDAGKNR